MTTKKIKQEKTNNFSLFIYVNTKQKKREPHGTVCTKKHRKQLHKKRHDWSREKESKTNKWAPPSYTFTDGLNEKRKERKILKEVR